MSRCNADDVYASLNKKINNIAAGTPEIDYEKLADKVVVPEEVVPMTEAPTSDTDGSIFIVEEEVEINDIPDDEYLNKGETKVLLQENIDSVKSEFVGVTDLDGTTIYKGTDGKVHAKGGSAVDIVSEETRYNKKIVYPTLTIGKYINTNGTMGSFAKMTYTSAIDVLEGDVVDALGIYLTYASRVNIQFRYVCAYDKDGNVLSTLGVENVKTYTVPSGVKKVVLTYDNTSYSKIVWRVTTQTIVRSLTDASVNTKINTSVNGGSLLNLHFHKAYANEEIFIEENHIGKNKSMILKADIGSDFDSIYVGHGFEKYNGTYVLIDSTNVALHEYTNTDSVVSTTPHGLTLDGFVFVNIKVGNNSKATLTLMSKSGMKVIDNLDWNGKNGSPFVLPNNCELSNVSISWECDDYAKQLWIFGDSYVGFTYDNRWAYYLVNNYDNVLIDGYSGRGSKRASESLENALSHGTPKYILWLLGMNDADSASAVNVNWEVGRDEMLALCERYNTTPIFATIPNVPQRNHSFKNAWVRNSGYRYIDFEKAVGSDVNTSWYDGMLSSDNVHPTTLGAKALYIQALVDVPELMQNNK